MAERIQYYSTNRWLPRGLKHGVSFETALFMGVAPDGGLYMPSPLPQCSSSELKTWSRKSYPELAQSVLGKFLVPHDFSESDLAQICESAYTFSVPVERIAGTEVYIARLDQGPTASFKDFAARFMARAMQIRRPPTVFFNILVATSGDTGSAIGEAYRGLSGFRVFLLYPSKEVSSVQKRQLDAIGDNVMALAIQGKFDDCQRFVKQAFLDPDLAPLCLTSANSINVARVLPQVVYYFYTYFRIAQWPEPVLFAIPSGNLGNALGCEIARRMGLPVHKIIIATNENDEVEKFLQTGYYQKIEPSRVCASNAMNVGNPSNLARFFELYGGTLDKDGYTHRMPDLLAMRVHLLASAVSDKQTIKTLVQTYSMHKILLEPHGAVGLAALNDYMQTHPSMPAICLETAHPAKFPELIRQHLNLTPEVPPALAEIESRPAHAVELPADYEAIKTFLRAKVSISNRS